MKIHLLLMKNKNIQGLIEKIIVKYQFHSGIF